MCFGWKQTWEKVQKSHRFLNFIPFLNPCCIKTLWHWLWHLHVCTALVTFIFHTVGHPHLQGMYDDSPGVEVFCQKYVEVMGEESDHVHIVALTDALQVRL